MSNLNNLQRVADGISCDSNEYRDEFLTMSLSERLEYIEAYAENGMNISLSLEDVRLIDMYLRVWEHASMSATDFAFLALGDA